MTFKWGRFIPSFLSALVISFALTLSFTVGANAVQDLTVLEVTGILDKIDDSVKPHEIYLIVDEELASGPLLSACEFKDDRNMTISMKEFVRRYQGRNVKLLLYDYGETQEAFLCSGIRQ
jgi:nitrous oxide reductase